MARDIASSDTMVAPDFAYRAGVAAVAARAGLVEEAIAGVRSLGRLDALPRSSTWLAGMVILMEAAWALGDGELASELAPLLEPFADRPAMPSLAVSCFGSVERALGMAARCWPGTPTRRSTTWSGRSQANASLGHWPLVALVKGRPRRCADAARPVGRPGSGQPRLGNERRPRRRAWGCDRRGGDVAGACR